MIQHEDTLVHHRMTHCLSIEAFFFAVMGLSLKELISTDVHKNRIIWTTGIFAISIISALIGSLAKKSILAAVNQIIKIANWWILLPGYSPPSSPPNPTPQVTFWRKTMSKIGLIILRENYLDYNWSIKLLRRKYGRTSTRRSLEP